MVNIMNKYLRRISALFLALSLCLVSCQPRQIATTMVLKKTEGTVNIQDGKQKTIEPAEQLGLYSGYQVETSQTSYAWINLDKVKLTKMDAESEIEIAKRKNDLEIIVHSGKLFFHVTEPLEDDESLDIRTSSMIVGVRGTCGWVENSKEEKTRVYILEGTVECQKNNSDAEDKTVPVSAGQMAEITRPAEGEEQIVLSAFEVSDIPEYIMEELREDDELRQKIFEESGLDIADADQDPGELSDGENANPSLSFNEHVYHGSPDSCQLTPSQARLFADELSQAMKIGSDQYEQLIAGQAEFSSYPFQSYAILFDGGNGIPGIFFSSGAYASTSTAPEHPGAEVISWAAVSYQTMFHLEEPNEIYHTCLENLFLADGYLFSGNLIDGGTFYDAYVYPLVDGRMQRASTMAGANYEDGTYHVDGQPASEEEFNQWTNTWKTPSEIGYEYAIDSSGGCWGMVPAEDVLAALTDYANQE